MPAAASSAKNVDKLLKSLLVLTRSVDYVLETRVVEAVAGTPLSSSKVQILRLLSQVGGHTASQVGRYLGVSKPAVTQLIDSMVRAKLVSRVSAKTDRREVNLHLTDQGRKLAREIAKQQRHRLRAALRSAGLEASDHWVEVMNSIAANLASAERTFNEYCLQCGAFEDRTCVLVGGHSECALTAPRDPALSTRNGRRTRASS